MNTTKTIKMTMYSSPWIDFDGTEHEERTVEWIPPMFPCEGLLGRCYVIYKTIFGRYKIKEQKIISLEFTNIWCWKLCNGWCCTADDYGKLIFRYDQLRDAIKICDEKNRLRKVKVKYM